MNITGAHYKLLIACAVYESTINNAATGEKGKENVFADGVVRASSGFGRSTATRPTMWGLSIIVRSVCSRVVDNDEAIAVLGS